MIYFSFLPPINFNAPKTIALCFPHTSHSLHLPSILPSVVAACVWLVGVCVGCTLVAIKGHNEFYIYFFFVIPFAALNNGMVFPHHSPPPTRLCSPLPLPPTIELSVVFHPQMTTTYSQSIAHLSIFVHPILALQSTELATARAHQMPHACYRPIASGGAKI